MVEPRASSLSRRIDDGAADARVAADIHVVVDDGIRDFAVTVDADICCRSRIFEHGPPEMTEPPATMEIERDAHALGIGENKFCRRILVLPGAQRPGSVIEVEDRRHTDKRSMLAS